eukprot:TCONS_00018863-protein
MMENINICYTREDIQTLSERASKYGPLRNKLSLKIKEFLQNHKYDWFLDNGTLLAAYRDNGKMIAWDDDFDMGVFFPNYPTDPCLVQKDGRKEKLLQQLNTFLEGTVYKARPVSLNKENLDFDYAEKIEIYDPLYGTKPFRASNYYHVSLDIQFYTCVENDVMICLHGSEGHLRCPLSAIFPTSKKLRYEGEWYQVPNDTLTFLESKYGYLGYDCKYNVETHLYEKSETK